MPLYEFECTDAECEQESFDVLTSSSKRDRVTCPLCEKPAHRKFASTYTIKFNTGGFYQTDYNNKNYQ